MRGIPSTFKLIRPRIVYRNREHIRRRSAVETNDIPTPEEVDASESGTPSS